MKVGICIALEKAPLAVNAGFDYVELAVSEIMARDPWDSAVYAGLPIEACNLFFPGGVKLFAENPAERFKALPYIFAAKKRLTELGVAIGVVGSGNQRRAPESLSTLEAENKLAKWLAKGTKAPGTTVFAPESLERSETNVGGDCASFSRVLKNHGVGYTADAYHLLKEWEANGREGGLDIPSDAYWEDQMPHKPTHLHLAQLKGRRFPSVNDPMLNGFFERLKELGYDDRVSLECHGLEPEDYGQAIANVRTYVE
jgi:sugar phosphate isomerase/epimerase